MPPGYNSHAMGGFSFHVVWIADVPDLDRNLGANEQRSEAELWANRDIEAEEELEAASLAMMNPRQTKRSKSSRAKGTKVRNEEPRPKKGDQESSSSKSSSTITDQEHGKPKSTRGKSSREVEGPFDNAQKNVLKRKRLARDDGKTAKLLSKPNNMLSDEGFVVLAEDGVASGSSSKDTAAIKKNKIKGRSNKAPIDLTCDTDDECV